MYTAEFCLKFKEIFIDIVKYVFPTIALLLSILSYIDSRKANKVRDRINKIDEKLKNYELDEKEKERKKALEACIEAQIINTSNKYSIKFWNSGKVNAYNVNFHIHKDSKIIVRKDNVPFEFLEPSANFKEYLVYYDGCPKKFKITTTWTNEKGTMLESKEQLVSL